MISIDFTPYDIDALHHERFHHPHPRVQLKMEAVYLESQGLPYHDICRLARISENTLRSYLRQYLEGGVMLYLVRETKSTTVADKLRGTENQKIHCGEKHFVGGLDVDFRVVTDADKLP